METPFARPRVLATRLFAEEVRQRLAEVFSLSENASDAAMGRDDLLRAVGGMDGLMVTPADRVDAELLDAAGPALRVVATLSVGLDHIDRDEAARRGVRIGHTPDVLTHATAEAAIAIMLSLLRRVTEGDRLVRAGRPWALSPRFMLGRSARGLVFGCLGYGRIGRAASRMAEGLGMRTRHTGRRDTGEPGYLPFAELLRQSDVLSVHCPLTPETRHLLDDAAFRAMRPGAVVINTARGAVIDEDALVRALCSGRLAGAGLDVFENEPLVHPGLVDREDVVLVPHLGSATTETRLAMGMLCADALESVLLGRERPARFA